MKRIIINGRFLTRPVTGVERYSIELVKALDALISKNIIDKSLYSFTIFAPRNLNNNLKLKNILIEKVGKLKGHLWEQIELPFYAKNDLLISPCNTGPVIKNNHIVTIHDASVFGFPNSYSLVFKIWYKFLFIALGYRAQKIITVSNFSKNELIKYCRIKENKITVIYEGKEHIEKITSDDNIVKSFNLTNKPFILAVSSLNINKNFSAIVKAIEIIGKSDFDVVIAGNTNKKVFSQNNLELPSFVKQVGYITDNELKSLYENTSCFIYPSFYEGFGLPPLEALACGCPVIASNTSSIPEVCGEAALYCDPYSPKDIADKIKNILVKPELQKKLKNKSLIQASNFSWEKCAIKTFELIKNLY